MSNIDPMHSLHDKLCASSILPAINKNEADLEQTGLTTLTGLKTNQNSSMFSLKKTEQTSRGKQN